MEHPHLIRNVALIGAMHHGKTSLMDTLVRSSTELYHITDLYGFVFEIQCRVLNEQADYVDL